MRASIIATFCVIAASATFAQAEQQPAGIEVGAYLVDVTTDSVGVRTNQGMRARLTTADGVPLAVRSLTFSIDGRDVCSELTDADGVATCRGPNAGIDLAAVTAAGGYEVVFAGDEGHASAAAHGPLVRVDGDDI